MDFSEFRLLPKGYILINESNVLDLYKKLCKDEKVEESEKAEVLKRFSELVNYHK